MKPQASLAPLEERDRVYRALLNRLTLAPDHRESLLRRGLTDEAIERLGYKSTPVVGFHALAQSLLDEGYTLFGVPGFYRDEDGRWTMAVWRRGILIPGTYFGKIQGFQIRLDHKMKKGGKFLTFSSRDELDGTMGENWCHMVGPVREKILLIEGYMKADIVHHFTGQTMLAIPGVTSLQHLQGFDSAGGAPRHDLLRYGLPEELACGKRIQEPGDFTGEIGYHIRYLFMGSRPQWFGRLHLGVLPESGQGSRVAVDSGAFCECLAVFTHFVAKTHFAQCNEVPRKIRSGSSCCFPLTMVIRP